MRKERKDANEDEEERIGMKFCLGFCFSPHWQKRREREIEKRHRSHIGLDRGMTQFYAVPFCFRSVERCRMRIRT